MTARLNTTIIGNKKCIVAVPTARYMLICVSAVILITPVAADSSNTANNSENVPPIKVIILHVISHLFIF